MVMRTLSANSEKMVVPARVEHDSLGAVQVPGDKLYGPQTQRCLDNFVIGDLDAERMPKQVVYAFGHLKKACAKANMDAGRLKKDVAEAIMEACDEVIEGKLDDHFPLRTWQTGSGTQSNMNSNEVIAKRATQILIKDDSSIPVKNKDQVHPNDMVNLGQSSNDVFPTVMHLTLAEELVKKLIPELKAFIGCFEDKEREYANDVKIGRTHMMDAVPLTLGQEMSAFAEGLRGSLRVLEGEILKNISQLAQGGTAVGTGLNTFEGFDRVVCQYVSESTGTTYVPHPNKFTALSIKNAAVDLSGAVATLATTCYKIACDIRLLGSGPRCGVGELILPPNEPGSSIMPGKVNPTQCEAMTMVCAQVLGNNQTVLFSGTQGHLQLNVMKPVITVNTLRSMVLLTDAMRCFRIKCLEGMKPDRTRLSQLLKESLMLVTCLTPVLGYDKSAKAALRAHEMCTTLRHVVVEDQKLMSGEEFDLQVDAKKMLAPKKN